MIWRDWPAYRVWSLVAAVLILTAWVLALLKLAGVIR